MSKNILQEKSYAFALEIIKLQGYLVQEKKEFVLSKQLLRSGTSVGANIEEAIGSFSKKDFVYKLNISYKEARESHYWIRLLRDSGYIGANKSETLLNHITEIQKIIGKIKTTMKAKYQI